MKKGEEKRQLDEIIRSIHELIQKPGYIYALCLMTINDLFMPVADYADADWWSKLLYQEFSYLFGILVKNELNTTIIPSQEVANEYREATYKLMQELHDDYGMKSFESMMTQTMDNKEKGLPYDKTKLLNSKEAIIESVFYSDSGAYDFQYWESAARRYENDDEWIKKHLGFSINDAVELSKQLKELSQKKGNQRQGIKDFPSLCRWALDVFSFDISDITLDHKVKLHLLNRFSVTPGKTNSRLLYPSNFNELEIKPIVKKTDTTFLLPISFNLSRSIDESPYYWISETDKKYFPIAQKNRGDYAEESTERLLQKVFGQKHVFRNVRIERKKSEVGRKKLGTEYTDIDVLAILGNKALIIQAKSKKMTLLSRQGDLEHVAADFKSAVQEAYDQGLEARKHVLARDAEFIDRSGKVIELPETINEAYIITVTTDNYPALEFQLQILLEKQDADPFSIAVNVFDLELLTKYLPDPFDFMFYVNQRIKYGDKIIGTTEIAALGYHLDRRLYIDPKSGYDRITIAQDFAALIDDDVVRERYGTKKEKQETRIRQKWKNENFSILIDQVKTSNNPGITDAVFLLSSLSSETADELVKYMEDAKKKAKLDYKPHSFGMPLDSTNGITYIVRPDSKQMLQKQLLAYSTARKYRSKANEWLGLGSLTGSQNIIDMAVYTKKEWSYDEDLERLANIMIRPAQVIANKVGRNEPCYCGSGKKYKKCHYLTQ